MSAATIAPYEQPKYGERPVYGKNRVVKAEEQQQQQHDDDLAAQQDEIMTDVYDHPSSSSLGGPMMESEDGGARIPEGDE